MQGEAQRCRERGMDDYLSKPLRLNELGPMLAKWLSLPAETLGEISSTGTVDGPCRDEIKALEIAVWDATVLPRIVGDNPAMHRRLLEKFILSTTEQVTRIAAAAAIDDTGTGGNVAHALKSAARTVGALQLGNLCEELELAGKAGDAARCSALSTVLPTTFMLASQRINKHLESLS
jgi:HPt (histidine-containing phosphotransfer) domain-containing protein